MKIIVCVKQIRHTYARTGMDPQDNFVGPEDEFCRVNPYDEAALGLAVRIKEAAAGSFEIVLLTLGPIIAESDLKRCLAIGADDLYQISVNGGDGDIAGLDPWTKAAYLAGVSRELGGDLILCGKESLDSRNGLIGAFMAHRLKVPFVSGISDLTLSQCGSSVQVKRNALRGTREVIQCSLPAVFSVDIGANAPDYPAYSEIRKAESSPIRGLRQQKGIVEPKTISVKVIPPRPRPRLVPPPDSRLPAFDRVRQLLIGSKIDKKGSVLTGTPESQVDGIISFLEENGFLEFLRKDAPKNN